MLAGMALVIQNAAPHGMYTCIASIMMWAAGALSRPLALFTFIHIISLFIFIANLADLSGWLSVVQMRNDPKNLYFFTHFFLTEV